MNRSDTEVVALQLGREPRGRWRVARRCPHGAPTVIAVAPVLEDGEPFPTLFWLTCPVAVSVLNDAESAGEHVRWSARAAQDATFADALREAAAAYRAARGAEAVGVDPCATAGVAGERDPLRVKCLHARAASALAGLGDPVGEQYLDTLTNVIVRCDGGPCVSSEVAIIARESEGADL